MKTSTTWKDGLLVVVSVAFTFLVGEAAVRMLLPAPYKINTHHVENARGMPKLAIDPQIGWVNAPEDAAYHFNATGKYGTTDAVYHVRKGFRATSGQPVSGPLLIAAGCSFTFGVGLNDQETWPWMLQEQMPNYQVINAGTNNYGTLQSIMRSDRLIAEMPDQVKMVVLGFAEFHLGRDWASQAYLFNSYPAGRPRFVRRGDEIASKGLVYFWAPGEFLQRSSLVMDVLNRAGDIANGTPSYDNSRELTVAAIRDFAKRCQKRNIAVTVVMLPNHDDQGRQEKTDHAFVLSHLREAGIPTYVPAFPRLADGTIERSRFLIHSDGFHPNPEYNAFLTEGIGHFLKAEVVPK